ncbi:hypothetical protein [Roseovarius sp. 2305UL8-3]|uniref:hypothetical protein n=1 Tax=Roseovarius conchicola TaxID=3121636 RepID=UPI003528E725
MFTRTLSVLAIATAFAAPAMATDSAKVTIETGSTVAEMSSKDTMKDAWMPRNLDESRSR